MQRSGLRIGAYQFRKGDELDEAGLFYDPAAVSPRSWICFNAWRASRDTSCGPWRNSSTKCCTPAPMIFAPRSSASICRSISRDWRSSTVPLAARRCVAASRSSCLGLVAAGDPGASPQRSRLIDPVHASAEAAGSPWAAKRKIAPRSRRGSFIDLKTIAAALLSRSFSLASLADFLKTPTRKAESGGHGRQLTAKYLGYLFRTFKSPGSATRPCATDMRCTRSTKRRLARSSAKRASARRT